MTKAIDTKAERESQSYVTGVQGGTDGDMTLSALMKKKALLVPLFAWWRLQIRPQVPRPRWRSII